MKAPAIPDFVYTAMLFIFIAGMMFVLGVRV